MARQVIETVTSDLSGERIEEGQAWTMELTPPDGRQNKVRLDISAEEAREFTAKGQEMKRRGRRPGTTVQGKSSNGRRRRGNDEGGVTPDPK